ncbi:MAG TPA: hypothetical protein V6D29_10610 [Leptolyngbyaceae cyanobacterium]
MNFNDESLILSGESLILGDREFSNSGVSLILSGKSLILSNESLILSGKSLILGDKEFSNSGVSLILSGKSLILSGKSLILNDESLILSSESLILDDTSTRAGLPEVLMDRWLAGRFSEATKVSRTDEFQDLPGYFLEVYAMHVERLKEA